MSSQYSRRYNDGRPMDRLAGTRTVLRMSSIIYQLDDFALAALLRVVAAVAISESPGVSPASYQAVVAAPTRPVRARKIWRLRRPKASEARSSTVRGRGRSMLRSAAIRPG